MAALSQAIRSLHSIPPTSSILHTAGNEFSSNFSSRRGPNKQFVRSRVAVRAIAEKDGFQQEIYKAARETAATLQRAVSETGRKIENEISKFDAEDLRRQTEAASAKLTAQAVKVSSELKDHADKAVTLISEVIDSEETKGTILAMAEQAPEPIKEIAETVLDAHSPEAIRKGAIIHDFCLGITYGALLLASGTLSFLLSGSVHALRFGTMFGGIILAISIGSLRAWKAGKSSTPYIIGQAVATVVAFTQQAAMFYKDRLFTVGLGAFASLFMSVFYIYVMWAGGNPPPKKSKDTAAKLA